MAVLAGCSSMPVAAPAGEAPQGAPTREVDVVAVKWHFEPEEIKVKQGEVVVLTLVSRDVTHGFKIKQIDLDVQLPPDQPVEVKLYAKEKGTVPFSCSHFCGIGHLWMGGEIIVE